MAGKYADSEILDNTPLDDSWWDSVMADEGRNSPQRQSPAHQNNGSQAPRSSPGRAPDVPASPKAAPATGEVTKISVSDWSYARRIFEDDQIVQLKVVGHNRGGLLVEGGGLQGFVPFSHLVGMTVLPDGEEREAFLAGYQGQELRLKIIECVQDEGRIVFSERAARADVGCRNRLFQELKAGDRLWGEVTNITDFGVFVDLGGVEGLIHISELSWGRVIHPSQMTKLGDRLEVQVLDVSPERCRVALSLKRLQPNPWDLAAEQHAVDSIVSAEITTISSYGAFARLDEGLEGLIHSSQIPLPAGATVKEYLSVGQKVDVRILQLDASRQRLGLSMILEPEA